MSDTKSKTPLTPILGGTIAVLVVALIVVAWRPWVSPTPVDEPSLDNPASADPVEVGELTRDWYEKAAGGDTKVEEVAPGLWRCASMTENVGGAAVLGFEYEMPRTLEGAVAASANYIRLTGSREYNLRKTRDLLLGTYPGLQPDSLIGASQVDASTRSLGMDPETGEAIDPTTGTPILGGEFWGDAYPRYGAYKVHWTTSQNGEVSEVYLTWIVPEIMGTVVGTDTSGVEVIWWSRSVSLTWHKEKEDWVQWLYHVRLSDVTTSVSNPGYEWLAAVTQNDDWCVPIDATDQAYPGTRMTG